MKTQSPETSLKVELKLIELIRQASISKRFNLVCSMARTYNMGKYAQFEK